MWKTFVPSLEDLLLNLTCTDYDLSSSKLSTYCSRCPGNGR